jgi:ATP-dependent Clp protease protease subunit
MEIKKDFIKYSKSNLSPSVWGKFNSDYYGDINPIQNDIFNRMMENRILFLSGEVHLYSTEILKTQLLYLESLDRKKDITIYINSPGGSIYDGLGLLDVMEYVGPDIITVNTGLAASMGAIILCSGTKGKRKALKRSRTMIHQPMGGGFFQQASDMEIEVKEMNGLKKELYKIISEKTGQSYSKVVQDGDRDYWMSSKEALEYGMIDKVIK